QSAPASHAHNLPDWQNRYALAEFQPLLERGAEPLASRQPGIRDHDPRELFWKGRHQPQPNQTAPVLAEEREVCEARRREPIAHPSHVALESVVGLFARFVRTAEPHEIRCNDAMAARGQPRDNLAIEK